MGIVFLKTSYSSNGQTDRQSFIDTQQKGKWKLLYFQYLSLNINQRQLKTTPALQTFSLQKLQVSTVSVFSL